MTYHWLETESQHSPRDSTVTPYLGPNLTSKLGPNLNLNSKPLRTPDSERHCDAWLRTRPSTPNLKSNLKSWLEIRHQNKIWPNSKLKSWISNQSRKFESWINIENRYPKLQWKIEMCGWKIVTKKNIFFTLRR